MSFGGALIILLTRKSTRAYAFVFQLNKKELAMNHKVKENGSFCQNETALILQSTTGLLRIQSYYSHFPWRYVFVYAEILEKEHARELARMSASFNMMYSSRTNDATAWLRLSADHFLYACTPVRSSLIQQGVLALLLGRERRWYRSIEADCAYRPLVYSKFTQSLLKTCQSPTMWYYITWYCMWRDREQWRQAECRLVGASGVQLF